MNWIENFNSATGADDAAPQVWKKGGGITADGKFAASASWDRTVKLWDLSDGYCMKTLDEFSDRVTSVAFNGREDYLVASNDDGTVKVWKLIWELKAPELPNDLP